jgi:FkbM family methyltransferase
VAPGAGPSRLHSRAVDLREEARLVADRVGLRNALTWAGEHWPSRVMRRERRDNAQAIVAMAARLNPDSNCIDVGAHAGTFLAHMVRLAPQGRHIAFEPLPAFRAQLRDAFPDVTLHDLALSDVEGTATFNYIPSMPGFSGLREVAPGHPKVERLTVRTARLDDVLDPELAIDLIKIDVEGAELQVLDGAERTLSRWRPMVLLEHGLAARSYGTMPADVHTRLTAAGLRVYDLDGLGPLDVAAFQGRIAAGMNWNWLAR